MHDSTVRPSKGKLAAPFLAQRAPFIISIKTGHTLVFLNDLTDKIPELITLSPAFPQE